MKNKIVVQSALDSLKASAGKFYDDAGTLKGTDVAVVINGEHVCPIVAGSQQCLNPISGRKGAVIPRMSSLSKGGVIRLDKHGGDYEAALDEYRSTITPGIQHDVQLVRLFD